jgi:hypothetical protein
MVLPPFNGDMKSLIVFVLTIAAALAADQKPNETNRAAGQKLSRAEHKAAADRHATRAEEFAAKARKHEEAAARIAARNRNTAMQHKWPGMARGAENMERDRAMQARRAEAESRELVAFHTEMANKTGIEAEP